MLSRPSGPQHLGGKMAAESGRVEGALWALFEIFEPRDTTYVVPLDNDIVEVDVVWVRIRDIVKIEVVF